MSRPDASVRSPRKPLLDDLPEPVLPIAPDVGAQLVGKGVALRVRTSVHAGGGEGTDGTDRSNIVQK